MKQPLVSCIMPTANRRSFLLYAIDYFLSQDYTNSELVILDDGEESNHDVIPEDPRIRYFYNDYVSLLGTKRNFCCKEARGDIIVHLDDDDWYATDWITTQVASLTENNVDITGLSDINFFLNANNQSWEYRDQQSSIPWVYGATLAYRKSVWECRNFSEMNAGEDNEFIYHAKGRITSHAYVSGYLGIIHFSNAGIIPYEDLRDKAQVTRWVKGLKQPLVGKKEPKGFDARAPLVSCIMPTANRPDYLKLAIANFINQDYPNKELVIVDDGTEPVKYLVPDDSSIYYYHIEPKTTIGNKRNLACKQAHGQLIAHLDDDDWYAADWLSNQVDSILNSKVEICGLNQVQYFSPFLNQFWMIKNSDSKNPWLSGQSLIYNKSFWEQHPFTDQQLESEDSFVGMAGAKVFAHDYYGGLIARLHANNLSVQFFEDPRIKRPYQT